MSYLISYFFGAMFLVNSLPHLSSGLSGRVFPTPFADPPGRGESSAHLNIIWAAINLAIGYGLVFQVGNVDIRALPHAASLGAGGLLMALFVARHFGRIYGGEIVKTHKIPTAQE